MARHTWVGILSPWFGSDVTLIWILSPWIGIFHPDLDQMSPWLGFCHPDWDFVTLIWIKCQKHGLDVPHGMMNECWISLMPFWMVVYGQWSNAWEAINYRLLHARIWWWLQYEWWFYMIDSLLHGRIWWWVHKERSRLWVERGIGEVSRELIHPNVHLTDIFFLNLLLANLILGRKLDWRLIRLENISPRPCCRDWDPRTAPAQPSNSFFRHYHLVSIREGS